MYLYLCRRCPLAASWQLVRQRFTTLQTADCDTPHAVTYATNRPTASFQMRTGQGGRTARQLLRRDGMLSAPLRPHYANTGLFLLATTQLSQPGFLTLRMQGLFNQRMPSLYTTLDIGLGWFVPIYSIY